MSFSCVPQERLNELKLRRTHEIKTRPQDVPLKNQQLS